MLKTFNFQKLYNECKRQDLTDGEIAGALGITYSALRRKLTGNRTDDISATQAASVCSLIRKPMDMFVGRVK